MRPLRLRISTAIGLIVLAPCAAVAQGPSSADARFLAGLRERRLFAPAEAFCRRALAEPYLSERRRAELVVELARTRLDAALFARSPERERLFAAATSAIDEALRERTSTPWAAPLRVQRGIVPLVKGERLREEAQLLHDAASALTAARDRLRAAVAELRAAREFAAEQLREAHRRRPPQPDLPTADELTALDRYAAFQLARASRNLGECYPPGSADRTSAVEQALEVLSTGVRSESADGLVWQARLDEALCRRLLGDLDGAERALATLEKQTPPPDVVERVRAQRIRVRLAAGELGEAKKLVRAEDADPALDANPDVRLAVLEWLTASAAATDAAGRTAEGTDLRNRAAALAALIAERHSAYWARRAEALAASAVAASPGGDDLSRLLAAADTFYHQGNVDRALEIYDQVQAKAAGTKRTEPAFQAGFTAAAVEQRRGRHAQAARRFAEAAASYSANPRAGEARLLAAFNTAQSLIGLKDAREIDAGLAQYEALLIAQLATQSNAPETSQARLWLGRLMRQRRQADEAARTFADIEPTSPQAVEAVREYAALRGEQLAELRRSGMPVEGRLSQVDRDLQPFAPRYPALPENAPASMRAALLARATLGLEYGADGYSSADAALSALEQSPETTDDQRRAIVAWRVVALVGQGRFTEATATAAKLEPPEVAESSRIAVRLMELAAAAPTEHRRPIAETALKLPAGASSEAEKLPPELQRRRLAAEANALNLVGRTDDARRTFEHWATQFPRDVDARRALAEFLGAQPGSEEQRAAIAAWREVERTSPPTSADWFRAKLGTARAYAQLGARARALQIVRFTEALHPELGGPELRARFLELKQSASN